MNSLSIKEQRQQLYKNRFNSLGIPVDNLSLNEAVERVFELVNQYKLDPTPKLVATLNVDFLVNSLGYRFDTPRHPELMEILRDADMITADGFPIVALSHIAGSPLKQRVTGADMVPAIAKMAAVRQESIYLLGGEENTAQQAADCLKKANPSLQIAGYSAPMVSIDGNQLLDWEKNDQAIVEDINASGASILFIGFGNPKQELWFKRNQHRLKVPVSIGIGGTFSFITGKVKRAPKWMQRGHMEWIFRMTQDPKRLIKRYSIGIFKLSVLTLPLLLQRARRGLGRLTDTEQVTSLPWQLHWAARDDILKTLRLPKIVSRQYLEALVTDIYQDTNKTHQSATYLIDFSQVHQVHLAANEAFYELGRILSGGLVDGLLIGMSDKLKQRFKASRVMDIAESRSVTTTSVVNNNNSNSSHCKTYIVGDGCLTYFSGPLSGLKLQELGFEQCMLDTVRDHTCVIDLRNVTQIDSTAIATLARITQRATEQQLQQVHLSGVSPKIEQMIKVLAFKDTFNILNDQHFFKRLFQANNHSQHQTQGHSS